GAVPAVRDQDGVPAPDLGEDIDRLVLPARGGLMEAEAGAAVGRVLDLVVVDLLELGFGLGGLVVLVGGVAGPVAAGGDALAGDQAVAVVEGADGSEIAHLAGHVAAAADLDRDVLGADQRDRVRGGGHRRGQREASAVYGGDGQLGADGRVEHIGGGGEHVAAATQGVAVAVDRDGAAAAEGPGRAGPCGPSPRDGRGPRRSRSGPGRWSRRAGGARNWWSWCSPFERGGYGSRSAPTGGGVSGSCRPRRARLRSRRHPPGTAGCGRRPARARWGGPAPASTRRAARPDRHRRDHRPGSGSAWWWRP